MTSPRFQPELDVRRADVVVKDLPPHLDGLTIAHISDLHVGPDSWGPMRLEEAAQAVREAAPDLVVNTGDFLRARPPLGKIVAAVQAFQTGVPQVAVLGNHDHAAGDEMVGQLTDALGAIGVNLLVNETTSIACRGEEVSLIGLDAEADGLERTMERMRAMPTPRIALLHEPDDARRLPPRSTDLLLCGHTHGGQITIPLISGLLVRRFSGSRFIDGLYEVNGIPVYVNRGLGMTGIPVRFHARPEVAFIRMRVDAP